MIVQALIVSSLIGVPGIELPKTPPAGPTEVPRSTPTKLPSTTPTRRGPKADDTHKVKSCFRKIGPFATRADAWDVWNRAKAKRLRVSRGVYNCPDRYGAGYCIRIYYNCR